MDPRQEALHRQVVAMFNRDLAGPQTQPQWDSATVFAEIIRLIWIAEDDLPQHAARALLAVRWLGEVADPPVARRLQVLTRRGPAERVVAAQEAIRRIRTRAAERSTPPPLLPPPEGLRQGPPVDFKTLQFEGLPPGASIEELEAARQAEQAHILDVEGGAWLDPEPPPNLLRLAEIGDSRCAATLIAAADRGYPSVYHSHLRYEAVRALQAIRWRTTVYGWPDSPMADAGASAAGPPAEVVGPPEAPLSEEEGLIRVLLNPLAEGRLTAAERLGEIGGRRAAEALSVAADDRDLYVQRAARLALVELEGELVAGKWLDDERPPATEAPPVASPAPEAPAPPAETPPAAEAIPDSPPVTADKTVAPGLDGLTPEERALLPQ